MEQASSGELTLRRSIGLWQMTLYAAGSMLGAGIYGLIGRVAGEMGSAIWLAFLLSLVAAGLTGLSYASLGSRYPRAGWRRLYHAARLSPQPAHPCRRSHCSLLGLHLDRRRRTCGGRESASPARP